MTNENLPPERPLSDQARAVRKADLMRQVTEERRGRRSWLVPALAAASVIAAVAVGGAVLAGGDDTGSQPGAPAGSGPALPSTYPETPTDEPSVPAAPSTVPGKGTSTGPAGDGFPVQPPEPCADLFVPVADATEISSIPIGDTTVRLYGNADRWIICDEWASLDGGVATLFAPHRFGEPLGRAQLGISMNFSMDNPELSEYVAGGALPDGVESITYTFQDGHVEDATIDGDMWAMAYFKTGRSLQDGRTVVDIGTDVGTTQRVTLDYPMDFCSQSNHGC